MPPIVVSRVPPTDAAVQMLVRAMRTELMQRYDEEIPDPIDTVAFHDPGSTLVLARCADHAVGCGGMRRFSDDAVELKRIFVIVSERGKGIAGQILTHLEQAAAQQGYRRAVLETGLHQPEAIALYRRHGYHTIAHYSPNAENTLTLCFEKLF